MDFFLSLFQITMIDMYLVLDFDGVMELTPIWKKPKFMDDGFYLFDETSRLNLIKLVEYFDPIIVISSSHRVYMSECKLKELMNNRGIFAKSVVKLNNIKMVNTKISRAQEIFEWVGIHDPDEYLVLDDDKSINNLPYEIKQHCILINPNQGITDEVYSKIINNYERKKTV